MYVILVFELHPEYILTHDNVFITGDLLERFKTTLAKSVDLTGSFRFRGCYIGTTDDKAIESRFMLNKEHIPTAISIGTHIITNMLMSWNKECKDRGIDLRMKKSIKNVIKTRIEYERA